MKILYLVAIIISLICFLVIGGCTPPTPSSQAPVTTQAPSQTATPVPTAAVGTETIQIRVFGGSAGGSRHYMQELVAEAIRRDHPDWNVRVITGIIGSTAMAMLAQGNMEMVGSSAYDMMGATLYGKVGGVDVPKADAKFIIGTGTYDVLMYLNDSVPVNSFSELVDKQYPLRMTVNRPGTSVREFSELTLEAYGITLKDIESWGGQILQGSSAQAATMLGDGIADCCFQPSSTPVPVISELATRMKLKAFGVSEPDAISALKEKGFTPTVVKGGTYTFTPEDIKTVTTPQVQIVPASLPDELAYEMTKAIWNQRDYLGNAHSAFKTLLTPENVKFLIEGYGDWIHPGAMKFWQEQGFTN